MVAPQLAVTTVVPDPMTEPGVEPTDLRPGPSLTMPKGPDEAAHEHPAVASPRVGVLRQLPRDIWIRPPPGWGHDAWREILADVVRQIDHDPEHHHGHHHGDE